MRLYTPIAACAALAVILSAAPLTAQTVRGVTATEIRIGQTMPYSGPVSAFGALGKGEVGYFKMVNERGGINGRKVNLISLDDGYAPPKTVEQTRRLVESDEVALTRCFWACRFPARRTHRRRRCRRSTSRSGVLSRKVTMKLPES
jgi:hypothetical protein